MSLLCRLKNLVHKGILKEKDLDRIVIIPKEQEPCEDCISRSHFDERVRVSGGMVEYEVSDDFKDGVLTVLEMLKTEPSIQPKSKADVLDKIRAEIETEYGQCDICEYFENYDYEENDISEYRPIGNIADILPIIDKHRAESEDKE